MSDLRWSDGTGPQVRLCHSRMLFVRAYPHPRPGYQDDLLAYRQALRDLPTTTPSPAEVVWPVRPPLA